MKTAKVISLAILSLALILVAASPAYASGPLDASFAPRIAFPFGIVEGIMVGFVRNVIAALALAALGAILVTFLPNELRRVSDTAQQSPMPSLGVGCLTLLVALPLFVLLVVMIVTIPAAILMPFVIGAAWVMGWITLGWIAGERLMQSVNAQGSMRTPVAAAIVGILVLALVSALPVLGWLVGLGIGSLGLGAVILSRFGTRAYPPAASPVSAGPSTPIAPAE